MTTPAAPSPHDVWDQIVGCLQPVWTRAVADQLADQSTQTITAVHVVRVDGPAGPIPYVDAVRNADGTTSRHGAVVHNTDTAARTCMEFTTWATYTWAATTDTDPGVWVDLPDSN